VIGLSLPVRVALGAVVVGVTAYAGYDGYDRVASRAPRGNANTAAIGGTPVEVASASAPAPAPVPASVPAPAAPAPTREVEAASAALAELEAALRAGFQEDVAGPGRAAAESRPAPENPETASAPASDPTGRIPVRTFERGEAPPLAASVPARREASADLELGCEVAAGVSAEPRTGSRFFDSLPADAVTRHTVVAGDTLSRIARTHGITAGLIRRANGLRSDRIRVGQRLAVPRGPFRVEVDRARFVLTVFQGDRAVAQYAVAIGRDGSTPTGEFKVLSKVENPEWQTPDGYYAADDPMNPLGERWIGIAPGYGIHGTVDPSSIGRAASRGCIRLANDDIEEVYDLLLPGAAVTIR
jgi:LysM repeat protein